jgi:hypothetical protein
LSGTAVLEVVTDDPVSDRRKLDRVLAALHPADGDALVGEPRDDAPGSAATSTADVGSTSDAAP